MIQYYDGNKWFIEDRRINHARQLDGMSLKRITADDREHLLLSKVIWLWAITCMDVASALLHGRMKDELILSNNRPSSKPIYIVEH